MFMYCLCSTAVVQAVLELEHQYIVLTIITIKQSDKGLFYMERTEISFTPLLIVLEI